MEGVVESVELFDVSAPVVVWTLGAAAGAFGRSFRFVCVVLSAGFVSTRHSHSSLSFAGTNALMR